MYNRSQFLAESQIEDINNNSHNENWWLVYGLGSNQLEGVSLNSYQRIAVKLTNETLNTFLNMAENKLSDVYKIFSSELESRK